MQYESGDIFSLANAFVQHTNEHIFITGQAGTGKTTLLRHIQANCKKKLTIAAPTGVAAINAGGVTLHSLFQLPFGTFLPGYQPSWGEQQQQYFYNEHQLLGNLKLNAAKRSLLKALELLIIDEISMVRADTLDAIDVILRHVRRRKSEPFGGVQMLYIGDLLQLPPVVKPQDWQALSDYYASPFFFDAMVMKDAAPINITLKKIFRQNDLDFIYLLNQIRNNEMDEDSFAMLSEHYNPYFSPLSSEEFITLTSHNQQADEINQRALSNLPGRGIEFKADIEREFPENAYPIPATILLKEGAQIMFIKNDKGENRRFYNGKIGTIEKIDEFDKQVFVRFKGENDVLKLEQEEWKNIRYQYDKNNDEIKEEVLGKFTHYPIRLAWAVTIHKSQGLTFDKAIVDAGKSFAPGQVYVALSRLTSLQGLILKSKIGPENIIVDPRVVAFSQKALSDEVLNYELQKAKQSYIQASVVEVFNWQEVLNALLDFKEGYQDLMMVKKQDAIAWCDALLDHVYELAQTASNFSHQLHKLLYNKDYEILLDRCIAAIAWFSDKVQTQLIPNINAHVAEYKILSKSRKYIGEIEGLCQMLQHKNLAMGKLIEVITALQADRDIDEIVLLIDQMQNPKSLSAANVVGNTSSIKGQSQQSTIALFKGGLGVSEIASQRDLAKTTIESHLAEGILTGEIAGHELIDEVRLNQITKIIDGHLHLGFKDLKAKIPDSFTYFDLKIGFNYLKYLLQNEQK